MFVPSRSARRVTFFDCTPATTIKIDSLRFSDRDLSVLGTLDRGQFGVVGVLVLIQIASYLSRSSDRSGELYP